MIYANNAATSWPKPETIKGALLEGLECAGSANRGEELGTQDADTLMNRARTTCAHFLGVSDPSNLMFIPSSTYGLNMIFRGFLKSGDSVIVARGEHNSVLRPLYALQKIGIDLAWTPLTEDGFIDLAELECLLQVGTSEGQPFRAVICCHGSNASGALQPIEDVVMLAHQYGAACISDGAQVAGHVPIDLERIGVDAWVTSGHKGLLGPKGVGLMYLAPHFDLDVTIWGGTGFGDADDLCDDRIRPSCYEPGTEPLPAILGVEAGINWLKNHAEAIAQAGRQGTELRERLSAIPGIRVLGPSIEQPHLPLVSLVAESIPTKIFGATLEKHYNILTRTGMHCSPDANKVLDSYPEGSVRFSLGPFSTAEDVDAIVGAVTEIVSSAQ